MDWTARLATLDDPGRPASPSSRRCSVAGGTFRAGRWASRRRASVHDHAPAVRPGIRRELDELQRVAALETPPPSVGELVHLALIPTYTEPLEKLRHTVRALAEADWPSERKICAIITRETDVAGIANVGALREEFGGEFAEFIHILDPLEPGIVVGKIERHGLGRDATCTACWCVSGGWIRIGFSSPTSTPTTASTRSTSPTCPGST